MNSQLFTSAFAVKSAINSVCIDSIDNSSSHSGSVICATPMHSMATYLMTTSKYMWRVLHTRAFDSVNI